MARPGSKSAGAGLKALLGKHTYAWYVPLSWMRRQPSAGVLAAAAYLVEHHQRHWSVACVRVRAVHNALQAAHAQ